VKIETGVIGRVELSLAVAEQSIFDVIEAEGEGLYEFTVILGVLQFVMVEAKVNVEEDFLTVQLRVSLHFQSQLHPVVELDPFLCMSGNVPEYLARAVDERTVLSSKLASATMRLLVDWLMGEGWIWYGMAKV
jgi:hypothetical protein